MWDDFAVFWVAVVMRTKQTQFCQFVNRPSNQSINESVTNHA
jgi:hypothetical protein